MLERSLIGLRTLIDRSLADVRVAAGMPPRHELIGLADFVDQIGISASSRRAPGRCKFTISAVDGRLALDVDRDMLLSAVGNLLQNASSRRRQGSPARTSCRRPSSGRSNRSCSVRD